MARLRIQRGVLSETLFPGAYVEINGAEWDGRGVVFEISGLGVPDCEEVSCTVIEERRTFRFEDRKKLTVILEGPLADKWSWDEADVS